jgi:hypothetical protein
MLEKHHMEPVSLGGRHITQNMIELEHDIHTMLHCILDVNGSYFRQFVRQMRIETNHHLITRPDHIERWADLQREFFSNLHKLPTRLQAEHIKKMTEQVQYDYMTYKKMTGTDLDKPHLRGNYKDKFLELHRCSKEAQKETSKVLLDTIRKHYFTL